jgi:acetylornithine/N-succinyldiaminopimelate aminotransferase
VVKALIDQGQKLWHVSNLYQIPNAERLAKRLTEATFADYVFFTNSGAEALEGAIKAARKYQFADGHPEKVEIITFDGAFHGRTLATIAAGGNDKYIEGFHAPVDGFARKIPFGDIAAVKAAINPRTAAILVEPIQGEGGIRVPPTSFLKELRQLCDEHKLLLVLDEVQCGMGRTGRLFAYMNTGVTPDIMSVAKGIGAGFPLGAFMTTKEAGKGMVVGTHGTTYGGNPLATAVGNAVLDLILAPGFLDQVSRTGLALKQRLAALADAHPKIIEGIRGEGLMLGLKIKESTPAGEFTALVRKEKMLVIPAGENVARLLPPLTITDAEIEEGMQRLDRACVEAEKALAAKEKAA